MAFSWPLPPTRPRGSASGSASLTGAARGVWYWLGCRRKHDREVEFEGAPAGDDMAAFPEENSGGRGAPGGASWRAAGVRRPGADRSWAGSTAGRGAPLRAALFCFVTPK